MKKRILFFWFFLLLLALLSSHCNDSIISPINENNLIPNPSFEMNGNSSLAFWFVNMPSTVNFIEGTPPNGGNWAITIDVLWGSGNDVITSVELPEGTHIYKFSLWSKYSNNPGFVELLLNTQDSLHQVNRFNIDSELWKNYTIVDTITSIAGDSLQIKLSGGFSHITPGKTYFDLCTLEQL